MKYIYKTKRQDIWALTQHQDWKRKGKGKVNRYSTINIKDMRLTKRMMKKPFLFSLGFFILFLG
tara:strand:- start:208 stop:399 length:192 start_codon:yes stop_codon:yes gene_type:complete